MQRIIGFWHFYGEWNSIAASPIRVLEVARQLLDKGLPAFAFDIGNEFCLGDDGELGQLVEKIERDAQSLEPSEEADERSCYSDWFGEAKALEAAGVDEPSIDDARRDAAVPGERGFEARRTLRRRGGGSTEERRAPLRFVRPPPE